MDLHDDRSPYRAPELDDAHDAAAPPRWREQRPGAGDRLQPGGDAGRARRSRPVHALDPRHPAARPRRAGGALPHHPPVGGRVPRRALLDRAGGMSRRGAVAGASRRGPGDRRDGGLLPRRRQQGSQRDREDRPRAAPRREDPRGRRARRAQGAARGPAGGRPVARGGPGDLPLARAAGDRRRLGPRRATARRRGAGAARRGAAAASWSTT